MTNTNFLTTAGILGQVIKSTIESKIPNLSVEIILSANKFVSENKTGLQVLIEHRESRDIINNNETVDDDLPNEKISKLVLETYSIKLMAFTNDKGQNLAIAVSHWITSTFNSQKARFIFQANNMNVSTVSNITSAETVGDIANLTIKEIVITLAKRITFNTTADYYDTFLPPNIYFQK